MEEAIKAKLKESGMIDVMQNKVLGPMMVQQYEQGRVTVLREQLAEKFGTLPLSVEKRLAEASPDLVSVWIKRILSASTLDEVLR
jgi:hypothetical protein